MGLLLPLITNKHWAKRVYGLSLLKPSHDFYQSGKIKGVACFSDGALCENMGHSLVKVVRWVYGDFDMIPF